MAEIPVILPAETKRLQRFVGANVVDIRSQVDGFGVAYYNFRAARLFTGLRNLFTVVKLD